MTLAGKALVSCQQRISRQYQSRVEKNTCARSATSEDNTSTGSTWWEGREGRKMIERRKRGMRMVRRKVKREQQRRKKRERTRMKEEEEGGGGREISWGREDHHINKWHSGCNKQTGYLVLVLFSWFVQLTVHTWGPSLWVPTVTAAPSPWRKQLGKKRQKDITLSLSYQSHTCRIHNTVNYYVYSTVSRPHPVPV